MSFDKSLAPLFLQSGLGNNIFRNNQNAGSIFIQSMHGEKTVYNVFTANKRFLSTTKKSLFSKRTFSFLMSRARGVTVLNPRTSPNHREIIPLYHLHLKNNAFFYNYAVNFYANFTNEFLQKPLENCLYCDTRKISNLI